MEKKTFEPQYQVCIDLKNEIGLYPLGIVTNLEWYDDPKRLLFAMSRYKFVSKMLSGKKNVLEVGCGDAFLSRIVLQEIENLTAIDADIIFIHDANARMQNKWKINGK